MLASSQFINYNQVRMSIPNILHKIKSKSGIDKSTIMYLFIIVGVGIGSFGLGRLSVYNIGNEDIINDVPSSTNSILMKDTIIKENDINAIQIVQNKEKKYVASKNGKMYYSLGCSGASRIKLENQIWFSTSLDAEKSGYSKSTSCN